ncbi:hypothetical protein PGTUg99_015001 [Puccinia graminis f. sp. tritici]|uniref:Uncharacterized protein n=1 Tax=Puccinia graminis f. sp. tritici TaxID=56615 RepID=A0A5B0M4A0_PUCGR|nr:hypothetical protein PGTUg99_015001 [Puccinia graminis f. sp. tritici]
MHMERESIHSHQELIGYDNRCHLLMQTESVHSSHEELNGLDNPRHRLRICADAERSSGVRVSESGSLRGRLALTRGVSASAQTFHPEDNRGWGSS